MRRKVRPGSRWILNPRNTTCLMDTPPQEREQLIRRIRRHRLPGEPSDSISLSDPAGRSEPGGVPIDLLGTLRDLCQTLQKDRDAFEAWFGLSRIFEALEESGRSGRCLDVALRLRDAVPLTPAS